MDSRSKDIMTVLELCEYLQMSEAKVREMLRQGTIPAVLIGRQWRIRRSAIDSWLAEQEKAVKVIPPRVRRDPLPREMGRLDRALLAADAEHDPMSLPKPPGQLHVVEEADPGAHKPLPAGAPGRTAEKRRRK